MPTLEQMGYVEIQGAIPGDGYCCGWCNYNSWGQCLYSNCYVHELRGVCRIWERIPRE
jgi:hypothetical protein